MTPQNEVLADFRALFDDDEAMGAAIQDAVRDALLDHKRTGDPIVAWQDGKVVWIPAERIEVD